MSPPMRACDEDDGRPRYQVNRFQKMAPIRAARVRAWHPLTISAWTMPFPMVWATLMPMNAPTRLSKAAMSTAVRGESTLVETIVAIALAESWAPLVKSKMSATATTTASKRTDSGIFQHDPFDGLGQLPGAVEGLVDAVVNMGPLDDVHDLARGRVG